MGKILAAVHSLNVAISKENRFDPFIDGMVKRLRRAPRWDRPQKMRTTQAKWEGNLVSHCLILSFFWRGRQNSLCSSFTGRV